MCLARLLCHHISKYMGPAITACIKHIICSYVHDDECTIHVWEWYPMYEIIARQLHVLFCRFTNVATWAYTSTFNSRSCTKWWRPLATLFAINGDCWSFILPSSFWRSSWIPFCPSDDDHWQLFLQLMEIVDHLFCPAVSEDQVGYLSVLINEYHTEFIKLPKWKWYS